MLAGLANESQTLAEDAPGSGSLDREDSVSEESKSVAPMGSPNIHSQNSTGACRPPSSLCSLSYAGHFRIDGECWFCRVVSVGNKPPSDPSHCGTQLRRAEAIEIDRVPALGKILPCGFDGLALDVLAKDPAWLTLVDDSPDLGPEIDGDPAASACGAEPLAWEPSREEVDTSEPPPVEGAQVVPGRSAQEPPRLGVDLDAAKHAQSRDDSPEPAFDGSVPCAQGKAVDGTCSHTKPLRSCRR